MVLDPIPCWEILFAKTWTSVPSDVIASLGPRDCDKYFDSIYNVLIGNNSLALDKVKSYAEKVSTYLLP